MSVRAPVNILTALFKRTPGHVSLSCLFSPSWANMVRPIDQAMFGSLDQWWLIFCVLSWGVQLALIPLLFSSIRGNLVANLFDLTIEVLILLTTLSLPSFVRKKRIPWWICGIWSPPPIFTDKKEGSLLHDALKASFSGHAWFLTAINAQSKRDDSLDIFLDRVFPFPLSHSYTSSSFRYHSVLNHSYPLFPPPLPLLFVRQRANGCPSPLLSFANFWYGLWGRVSHICWSILPGRICQRKGNEM